MDEKGKQVSDDYSFPLDGQTGVESADVPTLPSEPQPMPALKAVTLTKPGVERFPRLPPHQLCAGLGPAETVSGALPRTEARTEQ